jgi:hypothetical protein
VAGAIAGRQTGRAARGQFGGQSAGRAFAGWSPGRSTVSGTVGLGCRLCPVVHRGLVFRDDEHLAATMPHSPRPRQNGAFGLVDHSATLHHNRPLGWSASPLLSSLLLLPSLPLLLSLAALQTHLAPLSNRCQWPPAGVVPVAVASPSRWFAGGRSRFFHATISSASKSG